MKNIIVLTLILLLGVAGLSAMANIEEKVSKVLVELPYHEVYDLLFAENRSKVDEPLEETVVQQKIIVADSSTDVDMDEVHRKIEEAMRKVEEATGDLDMSSTRRVIAIELDRKPTDTPYMGITTEDLTLSQASDFGYNRFYGILVARVVPNSPARAQRILPDDIIMEIDGQRVTNRRIFTNIVDSYNIGDTVRMKIFRNRQEMDINFTFGSRHEGVPVGETTVRKQKIYVGSLGGGWIPMWYTPDMDDLNGLISAFGFTEIDDRGQFLNGGGGKLNIGKGLFLGGMGAGYSQDRRIFDPDNNVIRRMKYSVGFGGVTLEQRIPITSKFITSFGSMLGWGSTKLEISQNDGNYDWEDLPEQLSSSVNNYLNLSKSHIFLQPKVEMYYRLNNWLSIRGEAGYILSYSYHSGWNIDDSGEFYEVKNSPNTSFDGLTLSVGPWFGF